MPSQPSSANSPFSSIVPGRPRAAIRETCTPATGNYCFWTNTARANLSLSDGGRMDAMRRLLAKAMKPNRRKCEEVRALMSEYVDGDLDRDGRKRVERHVRFCHRCHTVLGNLRKMLGRLRGLQEAQPAGGDNPDTVAARVARSWR